MTTTANKRIRFTKEELLSKFIEVVTVPETLQKEMQEPPLIHLISSNFLKPMHFEENPFAQPPAFGGPKHHGGGNQGRPQFKKAYGGDES